MASRRTALGLCRDVPFDSEACYRAMESRDRRFEGKFIIGVRTTGIYCRPGCPAPIPMRKNVAFFRCAAAAEAEGLRPCLRCRPDALPSSAGTLGTPPTIARALRMIADGALDEDNVGELAERLGVGERHLRRLFSKHLGASPVAIVQTQRVHFARKLLDETMLPMTEVAHSAGFSSVRRFNDAIHNTFRETPTGLRRRGLPARNVVSKGGVPLTLRLPYRAPLDWDGLLAFLAPRAIPGVERVEDGVYARTIDLGTAKGTLEVRCIPKAAHVLLTLRLRGRAELLPLVSRVRRLFDLDADPSKISAHLRRDPLLAKGIRKRPHLRVPGAWDGFELAVRAILGQQVTVKGATTLSGRLVTKLGLAVGADALDGLTHFFPTPAEVVEADLADLGLPRARFETIRSVAVAMRDEPHLLDAWSNLEDGIARLTAIPGIGAWTAHYIAMRAAREPDAFPAGDLALRRRLTVRSICPTAREVEARAERWRPFRAYAAMHLWSLHDAI